MEKVLIFGSSGQLGSDLLDVLGDCGSFEIIPLTHEMVDCRDADAVRRAVFHCLPQFVINCAAYVRVDDCEEYPSDAFAVNAIGAFNIARASAEVDACCVYISTDYVFDGEKKTPYVETDPTGPINVYGASKLAGEHLVRQSVRRWLIVRTASLFGKTGARSKGGNFIETILTKARAGESLTVVNDIYISPTYTRDVAKALESLLSAGSTGVVHSTNRGSCTWYDLAETALKMSGVAADLTAVPSSAYSTRARRPKNSVLKTERPQVASRCAMPSWQEALRLYLREIGHLQSAQVLAVG
jgi:dTDP-4-dehydrorhamnose reductase